MLLKVILISIIYLLNLRNAAADKTEKVPGGNLKPGMSVVIKGTLWSYGASDKVVFTIDFQEANDDIGFHMSFRYVLDQLVLNSRIGDKWQGEEIHYGLPEGNGFYGESYALLILATEDHFEITINDRKYPDFKYRTDIKKIAFLNVQGSFKVESIDWQ